MRIVVRYFAAARERAGVDREEVEVPAGATVEDAWQLIERRHSSLAPLRSHLRLAVDREFADSSVALRDGCEVAVIPPVAGGSRLCDVRSEPVSLDEVVRAVAGPGFGGVVTFTGLVRDQSRGRRVHGLSYEAYREMAVAQLDRIAGEAVRQFGAEVAILHRVGELKVGDVAVVIAAAAAHREEAFAACRYAIEELKKNAPIWKKEAYEDGESWVGLGP